MTKLETALSFDFDNPCRYKKIDQGRYRDWTFCLYPGKSAPDDYLAGLFSLAIPGAISPVHDENNPDGSHKDNHCHVLLQFDGCKSQSQVNEISQGIFHGTIAIPCNSPKGLIRYFCHLDNPEKRPYDPRDIIYFGGLKSDDLFTLSITERSGIIGDICDFCSTAGIFEFSDLVRYCRSENPDWLRVLFGRDNAYSIVQTYLQSFRHGGF